MKKILTLLLVCFQFSAFSQSTDVKVNLSVSTDIKISGRITSVFGLPLAGASVQVKNGARTTSTDATGAFSITAPSDAVLVVSFVGFQKQEVPVAGKTELTIALEPAETGLGEVVVLGYNSQKKASLTGAISTVNMADLDQRKVPDVAQALQGQVAGVQITQSTGAPGEEISIRIRGEGTIGNNSPLFIIDGIPSRDITFLNPADIQSITVLKDASAAAIYGSRASAGVIVVTTRGGRKGPTKVDINYFNGIQKVANLPKMLNREQYMSKMEESWNNSDFGGTNPYTPDKGRADLADTDWQKELFELGHSQNLQLTATGGNEKVQFLLSGGYYRQDGIVAYDHDKYKRYTFRTNINANITDRLRAGLNLVFSYELQDKLSSKGDAPGIIRHALIRPPVIPVYKSKDDPTYKESDPFTDLPFYKNSASGWESEYEYSSNPLALAYFTNDKRNSRKTFGNVYAEYAFLKDKSLKLRTNFGLDLNMTHNKAFNLNFGDDDGGGADQDKGQGRKNRPNNLIEDRGEEYTITWNNTLNYTKSVGKHAISALLGTEFISNYATSIGGSRNRYEYINTTFQYLDYGNSSADVTNGGSASEWSLFSLFGSATYVYDTRYMATVNLRADASSRFAPNNQWGYFPSASVGWRISQEKFLQDVSWLSDLKLRASTGTLGNQEIGNYTYLTLLRKVGEGFVVSRYGNPDLKWESTQQNNFGIDIGLLRNKIYLSVDYFTKNTSGILLPISLPSLVGNVSPTILNAGEVSNKGIEVSLNIKNNDRAFKYSINANMATVTNTVEKLHVNLPNIPTNISRSEAGHPLSAFYGYVMEGIYQNAAEITSHLHNTLNTEDIKPGDIKFKDLNNDGEINDNDRTFIGNPNPKLSYGLSLSGSFKNFDLGILFQGVQGVDKYNDLRKITDYDTRPFNHSIRTLEAWHGEGTSNTVPRSTFRDNGSSRTSDIFVEDASYLRLKNLEIGYSFASLLKRTNTGIQNVRLYISTQNLFTITDYTGLDPESTDFFDQGTYPQSRALLFGVNVQF
ncbi:SusC/RagA family TonB-linked outer membrane protein [Chitinophaga sp. SYP-B3965]|uniref:SusC/RagA family TonB-linked outer membrane protein n=1 Tax=Chitinophaga sp. SYP-B3965 TaxID=2663120 RepID=UPI001299E693|nr:TonB-dependent receptor [Chitinophaga sp. SYP-B3965]MRG47851.1 SusC/RagA family TonB-linked outer membrane protein [Chitinophaga sp. SYP-B3965]